MPPKTTTKILFVITKSNWGGAQRYVFDLATGLNNSPTPVIASLPTGQAGPTIDQASTPEATSPHYDISVALGGNGILADKLRAKNIRAISIPALDRDISFIKDISAFIALFQIFRAEHPDVVHLNSSKIGLLGGLAARLTGIKKIIFTAHGWTFNEDRPLFTKLFFYLTSWLTGLLSTDIIVLSDRELTQTKKLPFVIKKTHRIYNGIKKLETLPRDDARKKLSEKIHAPLDNKIIVGTISELHANKGLEYAIRAISSLSSQYPSSLRGVETTRQSYNNLIFIIIGGGEDEAKLQALIKKLNLENIVFLTGFIENASEYLSAFDIFTITSIKEGLPYVLLEAGSYGLPIIASGVGGIPEILDNGRAGFLTETKDATGIVMALNILITDQIIANRFSKKIKERIDAIFTLDDMIAKTKKIYVS